MKNVVLVGDSIRMGYQPIVQAKLQGWAEVWGPERNGGTSRNVRENILEEVIAKQPDVVHLNAGLHDLAKDEPGRKVARVSLDEYQENLRFIFRNLVDRTHAKVMWATITPVHGKNHSAVKGFDRWEVDVDAYNAVARGVANEFKLPVDDLFAVITSAGRDRLLLSDGVHYTPEGSELLGDAAAKFIRANA